MERRIFHGQITPDDFSRSLVAHFNRGNLQVQQIGTAIHRTVQIATRNLPTSGGQTAISVDIQAVEDGVCVQIGQQTWVGVAASLGLSALTALRNPWSLLGRLDDIAQDIESLRISEEVWQVVDGAARAKNAGTQLSERLRRMVCSYCTTANPVGEPSCIGCGAPLGDEQPGTCQKCGFVITSAERNCPNCGTRL